MWQKKKGVEGEGCFPDTRRARVGLTVRLSHDCREYNRVSQIPVGGKDNLSIPSFKDDVDIVQNLKILKTRPGISKDTRPSSC